LTPSDFGSLLRELRLKANLSQEALAERARMSAGAISALERGARRAPYRSSVDLIADGLAIGDEDRRRLVVAAAPKRRPRHRLVTSPDTPPPDRRGRLPLPLNACYGREELITTLIARLELRRLITLCGPGGVGKTRVAIETAARMADFYPDGVRFVDLTVVMRPTLVAAAAAMALDVAVPAESTPLDAIGAALEGRRMLVVFDNCEHVLDAAAELIGSLVARCAAVRALTTSREPLRVPGELVIEVVPLTVESPSGSGSELSPAAELFAERVRDAGVALDIPAQRAGIELVCRRLDGIPLAIELAAARIRSLSVREIAEMLDERFAVLVDAGGSRVPRHRTLSATLDWSYELLGGDERQLFRRLAVFPGSWSLDGALTVCGTDAEGPLRSLVDRSLITVQRTGDAYRYAFGETVRQYAYRLLTASGEEARQADAIVAFALAIVQRCAEQYRGPTANDAIREVDAEYSTIRAGLTYAAGRTGSAAAEPLHQLVQGLTEYWMMRGAITEAIDWATRAVDASAGVGETLAARTRLTLARFLRVHHRADEAQALDESARVIGIRCGDRLVTAEAVIGLAGDEYVRGRLDTAFAFNVEALTIARETGNDALLARVLHNLAMIATMLGELAAAQRFLVESRSICTRRQDRRGLAWVEFRSGFRAAMAGDLDAALAFYRSSIELFGVSGESEPCTSAMHHIAIVAAARKGYHEAAALEEECLAIARARGYTMLVIETSERIAHIAFLTGDRETAAGLFARAAAVRARVGFPLPPRETVDFAHALNALGDSDQDWNARLASASDTPLDALAAAASAAAVGLRSAEEVAELSERVLHALERAATRDGT
jgi:predicted ATPase